VIADQSKWPYHTMDLAQDYELILAFTKVINFLKITPQFRDEEGESIVDLNEIIIFRKLLEPKLVRIMNEEIRRYNLKIENINASASSEQSSTDSIGERKKVVVWTPIPT
jgi:hypothetical protein